VNRSISVKNYFFLFIPYFPQTSANKMNSSNSFIKIAVTGSAGSGKSLVCRRLGELGFPVISLDVLAREAVAPGSAVYLKIVDAFGKSILTVDGNLNRRLLRQRMLEDQKVRRRLESLIHPEVIRLMEERIKEAELHMEKGVVVEVPLLFESGLENRFDLTVNISSDREVSVRRLMDRDMVCREEAAALIDSQMPDREKCDRADVVLKNTGSLQNLLDMVNEFYKKINREC